MFLQRCFKFLENNLIKTDSLLNILSNEEKIEETHIIVDSTLLTVESLLLSLILNYKILQWCRTCAVLILIDEDYKICYDCMKLYHLKCIKKIKSIFVQNALNFFLFLTKTINKLMNQ